MTDDLRNPNGTATRWDLMVLYDAIATLIRDGDVVTARAELIKQLNVR